MTEVLQTNIFFIITSGAVIIVTLLLIAVLVYILQIIRNVRDMSNKLKEGSELLAEDFKELHVRLQGGNFGLKTVLGLLAGKFLSRRRRTKRKAEMGDDA